MFLKFQGGDSVTDCIYNDSNDTFIIQQSYNVNDDSNDVLNQVLFGFQKLHFLFMSDIQPKLQYILFWS